MFILIFIIYKKRNLLFLLNYTNISFINICSCANYIIYLKKKKEKTKYVKRQILENFYRRITEERGKKREEREMLSVSSCFRFHRYKSWRMLERRSRIDTRTRYRANKSLIGFMRLIARKQKLWEYPISCILCASIHQDKQNISEATRIL